MRTESTSDSMLAPELTPEPGTCSVGVCQYLFVGRSKQIRKEEGTHSAKGSPARVRKHLVLCFHPYVAGIFMFTLSVSGAILAVVVGKAGSFED